MSWFSKNNIYISNRTIQFIPYWEREKLSWTKAIFTKFL